MKQIKYRFQNKISLEHRVPRWIEVSIQIAIVVVIAGKAQTKKSIDFRYCYSCCRKTIVLTIFLFLWWKFANHFTVCIHVSWIYIVWCFFFVCSLFSPTRCTKWQWKIEKVFFYFLHHIGYLHTNRQTSIARVWIPTMLSSIVDFFDLLAIYCISKYHSL